MELLFAEIMPCEQAQIMPFLALAQVCFTAVFIASCPKKYSVRLEVITVVSMKDSSLLECDIMSIGMQLLLFWKI